jgi:pimeloyl-ACP methyl ester carboxylesterase
VNPIVVLHGALGSAHQFKPLLASMDRPARIMEFLGHGDTVDVDRDWTIDLYVDQLEAWLQAESLSSTHIFGYSMGGYVALTLALRRPDLVNRIVALGTKLEWSVEQAEREVRLVDVDTIIEKVPRFAEDLERRHGKDRWQSVVRKTAALMVDLGRRPRLSIEGMSSMSAAVRYMIGDRDEMVSLEETRSYYAATAGAEFAVLPATRHPIEKVRTELIAWHVMDFLR